MVPSAEMGASKSGRISVLAVVGQQEPLIESATAAVERRAPTIPLGDAQKKMPSGLEIDPSIPAVPVGTGRDISVESVSAPKRSQAFAVTAFVDTDDPAKVPDTIGGTPIFSNPKIEPFTTCGGDPAVGAIADVEQRLKVAKLAANGLDGDGVAIAIMDTGINLAHLHAQLGRIPRFDPMNSWTAPGVNVPHGQHPVGHGTMCAYDALIAAPKATLLDFPILSANAPGGAATSGTIAVALIAFATLLANWAVAFARGGANRYKALVVNNSWGIYHPSWDLPPGHRGRYIDNPNHPFHLQVTALARSDADILFAAGNCGAHCPDGRCQGNVTQAIMGANAHADVLTLAGCDVNDAWVGYSSQGPSIANMPREKPDITAYTHFHGSEAFGAGTPDTGTSTACPVAAGCVAALRTNAMLSPQNVPPSHLFAQLRTTARKQPGQTGWNKDTGHGIIDVDAAAQSLGLISTS